jgi:molybdopterin-binding protein
MNDDILYKPEEIAQKLKITKGTVYEMIKRGDLEAHRIGKHLRISGPQLELYLLKSKGAENRYEATISYEDGEKVANIGAGVNIYVNTQLEGSAKVSIRPEDIILSKGTFTSSARNMHQGRVTDIIRDSSSAKVVLDIGVPIIALITEKSLNEMEIKIGDELYAVFKTVAVRVFK